MSGKLLQNEKYVINGLQLFPRESNDKIMAAAMLVALTKEAEESLLLNTTKMATMA